MHETEHDASAVTGRSPELGPKEEPSSTRRGRGCLIWIVPAAVVPTLFLVSTFIVQPFKVGQNALVPTIDPGDWVLIDKLTPRISDYARGDIVLVKEWTLGWPLGMGLPDQLVRIIGQPGDTVDFEDGIVYVTPPDGLRRRQGLAPELAPTCPVQHWVLTGNYFVLGDNRQVPVFFLCPRVIYREGIVGRLWLW